MPPTANTVLNPREAAEPGRRPTFDGALPDPQSDSATARNPVSPVLTGNLSDAVVMALAAAPAVLATAGIMGFRSGSVQRRVQWDQFSLFGEAFQWLGDGRDRLKRWASGAAIATTLTLATYVAVLMSVLEAGSARYWLADLAGIAVLVLAWRAGRLRASAYLLAQTRLVDHTGRLSDPLPIALVRDLVMAVLVVGTAGLALPIAAARRLYVRLNRVWIGERKLNVDTIPVLPLYHSFLPIWAGLALMATALSRLTAPSMSAAVLHLATLDDPLAPVSVGDVLADAFADGWPALLAGSTWLLLATASIGGWRGWLLSAAARATTIGGYGFRFRPQPLAMAAATLATSLLTVGTLGLLRPVTRHVWMRIAVAGFTAVRLSDGDADAPFAHRRLRGRSV